MRTSLGFIAGCLFLAAGCAPKSDDPDISGEWDGRSSEWGKVVVKESEGTYTDTYGPGPGSLSLKKVGPRNYEGTWRENENHGGTLTFAVSEDGGSVLGRYAVSKTAPHRPGHEGAVFWKREAK